MISAPVSEIYSSVQGEGPYTGQRQVFFRLAGCPLRCRYCDTPGSLTGAGHPMLTVDEAVTHLEQERRASQIDVLSVTGGEPLAHVNFLESLLPLLQQAGWRVYLETAGVHADPFRRIMKWVNIVAMDIKLPSAGGRDYWKDHRDFLEVTREFKNEFFVKIVIEPHSGLDEIKQAATMLAGLSAPPLLVLQPVTPLSSQQLSAGSNHIADCYQAAAAQLPRVLVMPQQHKIWKAR